MTTRQQFDIALEELRQRIVELGESVNSQIGLAVQALKEQDLALAQTVITGDSRINDLQAEIEGKCMFLIATQQPFARDLRKIVSGFKISISLERMGDLAVDVAKTANRIGQTPLIKPLIDIPRMSNTVQKMIEIGLEAYGQEDEKMAREMSQMDDGVDHLYRQIFRELLLIMMEDPKTITQATYLTLVARFFERMGDYCTNIAEEVVYLVSGRRIDLNQ
ncbi:Phosphate transport system protein PhoU [Acididesulfobacillus acetoxydans]|uniref:Phosphate-specific transport system accessory protein PhoU n=1 Tax=Acididesulfobacillus acetoxydans TaxID=1561005 RepID=A0A8S0XXJ1_9FIRM|nr:phosphate signaling complex protein PhoU [Acididesulfobacillus acetoxydans]CAA7601787.1 Phosphate transport system protein PhoU [Acididesulfobacillus acetoxydans]CEJ09207.1 Phosphate-specific transport system accessory protein PhoU homolog [Acididesulfobacillus acetoxydans]